MIEPTTEEIDFEQTAYNLCNKIHELEKRFAVLFATLRRMPRLEGFRDSLALACVEAGISPQEAESWAELDREVREL